MEILRCVEIFRCVEIALAVFNIDYTLICLEIHLFSIFTSKTSRSPAALASVCLFIVRTLRNYFLFIFLFMYRLKKWENVRKSFTTNHQKCYNFHRTLYIICSKKLIH